MNFIKMHGLGNDFICLDHFLIPSVADYPELARYLCHRQLGVGADGLIVILPSDKADVKMRIFNADGSEPEMCGNGIRCLARYVYEKGYLQRKSLKIETKAGILNVGLKIEENKVKAVKVGMGEPILNPKEIPVLVEGERALGKELVVLGEKRVFSAVSMGNPHCILFVEDLEEVEPEVLGPAIENHPCFPQKTNVEFVVVENRRELTMKVWERGVGPTLACGTGACAVVVAAILEGRTENEVLVHLPGGDLKIEWATDNQIYMTGPAEYVFKGQLWRNK